MPTVHQRDRRRTAIGALIIAVLLITTVALAAVVQSRTAGEDSAARREISAEDEKARPLIASPVPTVSTRPVPQDPSVLFIGDSFTEGFGSADERRDGWAYLVARDLQLSRAVINGYGGTGFSIGNFGDNRPYPERIRLLALNKSYKPDLIVFQGGLNDSPNASKDLEAATDFTLAQTHLLFPGAQIMLIGPISWRSVFGPVNQAYRIAAQKNNALFIQQTGLGTWLPNKKALYYKDGYHPSTEGHRKIAEGVEKILRSRYGL